MSRTILGLVLALLVAAPALAVPPKPPAPPGSAASGPAPFDAPPARNAVEPPPWQTGPPPVANDAKPAAPANDASSSSTSNGFALSAPAWLADSGLPLWAWLPLGLLALVIVRRLFGRGGDRPRDLLGPPPAMRPGARTAVTPPPSPSAVPPSGPRA